MNCFSMLAMRSMNNIWAEAARAFGEFEILKSFLIFKFKTEETVEELRRILKTVYFLNISHDVSLGA